VKRTIPYRLWCVSRTLQKFITPDMKFLCITDIHNRLEPLQHILNHAGPIDGVLLGGDLTNFGTPADVEKIVQIAQSLKFPVLAVAGNCDSAAIDQRLVELGVSIAGRGMIINDIGIHGLSAAPPWHRGMYGFTEEELARHLQAGYSQVKNARRHVVLTHVPPRDMKLDRTHFFQHVGSTALREFVEQTRPALVVCGHLHESRGVDMLGPTVVVNCGPAASGYYAIAEIDDQVRVDLCRC
jgi:Icc-related predicted phosphoesterase